MPVLALAGPTSEQVLHHISSQPPFTLKGGAGGAIFVFEADEYQNKLAWYFPFGIILTNVELDHPDYFKTEEEYEKVFEDFIKKVPADGFLIDGRTIPYEVGKHFEFDAQLATLAAQKLGVSDDDIKKGIASFEGSPRRMQKISDDPLIYDDYGHHPTEIKTTLRALRNKYPDKEIWAVFHPHTYSRTQKFLKEFGASFTDANHVIVLDIFESREIGHQTISSKDVVTEIKQNGGDAYYLPTFDQVAAFLKGKLNDKTLLLTIGAGDVWKLHKLIK
jgi:UDP-N-acetylmuramate--alanine ligase